MANFPVFNAHRNALVDLSNKMSSVSYDLVTINQGCNLNGATGVFTAPIKGLYFFSYSDTTLATSLYTAVKLYKNGDVVAAGYVDSGVRPWIVGPIFAKATLMLLPGDQVSVRQFGTGANPSAAPGWRSNNTITFTGFLLNPKK